MKFTRLMAVFTAIGILEAGPVKHTVESEALKARVFNISFASSIISIDGIFDESAWSRAASTDNFLEFQPGDNVEPPVPTEVKVTYDKDNLYVEFKAYSDPKDIRATLQKRDQAFRDDFVAILIDTYGDANSAVMIGSNPLGVQLDALNTGGDDDETYDVIYAVSYKHLTLPTKA